MTGWIIIIALAVLTALGILAINSARRRLWQPVLAALVLAFAGYSWQGSPDYKSAPAKAVEGERGAADAERDVPTRMIRGPPSPPPVGAKTAVWRRSL